MTVAPSPRFSINGFDVGEMAIVAAGAPIVGTLESTAGCEPVTWRVASTDGTDDASDYTLVQSGALGQIVTTTATTVGTAGALECTVAGGINPATGVEDASLTYRVKWVVLTATGLAVLTGGEVEGDNVSDPDLGAVGVINASIRVTAAAADRAIGPGPTTTAHALAGFADAGGITLEQSSVKATSSGGISTITPIATEDLALTPAANGAGSGPSLRANVGTGSSAATRGNVYLGFRDGEDPGASLGAHGALVMKDIGAEPSGGTYSGKLALYPRAGEWFGSDGTTETKLTGGGDALGAGAGAGSAIACVDATGRQLSRSGATADGAGNVTATSLSGSGATLPLHGGKVVVGADGSLTFGADGVDAPELLFHTPTAGRDWALVQFETSSYGLTNTVIGWGHNFGSDTLPRDTALRSAGFNIELSYKKADGTINTEVYLKVTEAGDATLEGTTASVTTKVGDLVTVTGMADLTSAMVGKAFGFTGAASAGNNGSFKMATFLSATSAEFINAAGVASDANNGAIAWGPIQQRLWAPNWDHTNHVGVVGHAAGIQVFASDNVTTALDVRSDALALGVSGAAGTITTKVGSVVTLTGLSGITTAMVGNYLRLSGCASAGNNGYYPIASRISSSSVTITNAGGVASDANSGSIVWAVWRQPQVAVTCDEIIAQGNRLVVGAAAPVGTETIYASGSSIFSGGIAVGDSIAPVQTLTVRGTMSVGASATDGFSLTPTATHKWLFTGLSDPSSILEQLDFGAANAGVYQSMQLNWNYGAGAGLLKITLAPTYYELNYGGVVVDRMNGTYIEHAAQVRRTGTDTVTLAAGVNADVAVTNIGKSSVVYVTANAAGSTLDSLAGGVDGMEVTLYVDATGVLTINDSGVATGTAANKLLTPGAVALVCVKPDVVRLRYRGGSVNRWLVG